jgi:hypothetical protein
VNSSSHARVNKPTIIAWTAMKIHEIDPTPELIKEIDLWLKQK